MGEILQKIDLWIRLVVANPYFGIVGFLIGLIGLIFAYYVAKRDKREKRLSCNLTSTNLITDRQNVYPRLNITYNNEILNNFTITYARVINKGNEVIKPSDIAPNDPIRFTIRDLEGIKLLDQSITHSSDPNNKFIVQQIDNKTVQLDFDYIEPGDGATIQILHTGKDSGALIATGTVIGARKAFIGEDRGEKFAKQIEKLGPMGGRLVAFLTLLVITILLGIITYGMFFFTQNFMMSLNLFITNNIFPLSSY